MGAIRELEEEQSSDMIPKMADIKGGEHGIGECQFRYWNIGYNHVT